MAQRENVLTKSKQPLVKSLGVTDYVETFHAMRDFNESRQPDTTDEIWLTEHYAVFTQGRAGKAEHLHNSRGIPVVHTDRGGQVTYHGRGQAIIYPLIDIRRAKVGVRDFVSMLENCAIKILQNAQIDAYTDPAAPGVYVDVNARRHKIASLGLRYRHGAIYHGIAINVDMDLAPFSLINPCGFSDMPVTQCRDLGMVSSLKQLQQAFAMELIAKLRLIN